MRTRRIRTCSPRRSTDCSIASDSRATRAAGRLSPRLAPETPAYDVQQACGTGLETAILVANKIALGQIDVGIACGADTTSDAPIEVNGELPATLLEANRQRSTTGKLKALTRFRPGHIVPRVPRN